MKENGKKNGHYSVQTGHALRGEYEKVRGMLDGMTPESIWGFEGLRARAWFVRRAMRRIPRDGRR